MSNARPETVAEYLDNMYHSLQRIEQQVRLTNGRVSELEEARPTIEEHMALMLEFKAQVEKATQEERVQAAYQAGAETALLSKKHWKVITAFLAATGGVASAAVAITNAITQSAY